MRVRPAHRTDLPAVEALLSANKLPTEGVAEHLGDYLVAEDKMGIRGAVGLERYGTFGLLRSAVVTRAARGEGIGSRLVEQLLDRAESSGVDEIYLLTTTAENYFPRFGFWVTTRAAVPAPVKASAEFRGACPDTAVVMRRTLDDSRPTQSHE